MQVLQVALFGLNVYFLDRLGNKTSQNVNANVFLVFSFRAQSSQMCIYLFKAITSLFHTQVSGNLDFAFLQEVQN